MRSLSDFLPFVMPYVNGCTESMAEQEILTACIDFCAKSCIVQNTQVETSVVDQPEYDVEVPASMELARVLAVYYGARRLTAVSREMVSHAAAARGEAVAGVTVGSGTPQEWVMRDPQEPVVGLYPAPGEAAVGGITIISAHQPARNATRVADILFSDYASDIAAGAIGRLLKMPNQPFSAPALAKPFDDQFRDACTSASVTARVGYGAARSFVKPRRFA